MRQIKKCGGAIIYFGREGKSSSVARYAVSSELIKSGHGASLVKGETGRHCEFSLIPSILQDIGVGSIRLVTNDIAKIHRLRELGVDVRGSIPLMR
jgi:GTP cyclohydrolase II